MANIFNYVEEYGDISFDDKEFNVVVSEPSLA